MRDLFLLTVLQLCLLISVSASEFASLSGDTSVGISTATASTSRKELPHHVLIGYAFSNYTNVRAAVMEDGVNVVIWAFMDIRSSDKGVDMVDPDVSLVARRDLENMNDEQVEGNTQHHHQQSTAQIKTNLDLNAISSLIQELNTSGYSNTVHLLSFGGWNGPHLDSNLSANEWYSTWRESIASSIFHGIDWDLEGNDDLGSEENVFTLDCLEKMGAISKLMKEGEW